LLACQFHPVGLLGVLLGVGDQCVLGFAFDDGSARTADYLIHGVPPAAIIGSDFRREFGESLERPGLRIYLAGKLCIEGPGGDVEERNFPGRQGRRAFAYLALNRLRLVPFDELAEAVWHEPPARWEGHLSAIVSKLRTMMATAAGGEDAHINTVSGAYQMATPAETWIDAEIAEAAIDEAEGHLQQGAVKLAWAPASIAATIGRRVILAGDDAEWIDDQRRVLHDVCARALDCLAEIYLAVGDNLRAVRAASECIALEPFRETGYQRLMRAHQTLGNRAEALLAYERCRRLLAEELGADPSPETVSLYEQLLAPQG
jgi:SARP family transcriptional regulator, regulator of embCAB operon